MFRFGVCCSFTSSVCGEKITRNRTFINNPSYPNPYRSTMGCTYSIVIERRSGRTLSKAICSCCIAILYLVVVIIDSYVHPLQIHAICDWTLNYLTLLDHPTLHLKLWEAHAWLIRLLLRKPQHSIRTSR